MTLTMMWLLALLSGAIVMLGLSALITGKPYSVSVKATGRPEKLVTWELSGRLGASLTPCTPYTEASAWAPTCCRGSV